MKPGLIKSTTRYISAPFKAFEGLGNVVIQGTKGAGKTVNFIGSGLKKVPKDASIGEKVYGGAIKGLALGGLGYGAYRVVDSLSKSTKPGASPYTIATRNRVLAGHLDMDDLSYTDRKKVEQLL